FMAVDILRNKPHEMEEIFFTILSTHGFKSDKARTCARIFMENSLEGVYTHGVNRFPRLVQYIREGVVQVDHEPECKHAWGGLEQWDGQSGPGPLNALACTDRAVTLADQHGIGCVALSNTNHWMRGGTYGWHAAKKGCVFIGWTNTIANMPAWGAVDVKLGNNPFVLAVPHLDEAIVLDMAMSQFSFGALELYHMKGEQLTVPGGFDTKGQLSYDPDSILQSNRVLPIGYWKGAGLSLLLDILATILSGGLSTHEIGRQDKKLESNLSQVFIAINLSRLGNHSSITSSIQKILDDYRASVTERQG